MDNIEKMNSAAIKAMFSEIVDRVKNQKQPIIVQRHNKDVCALVPLEYLNPTNKQRKKSAA